MGLSFTIAAGPRQRSLSQVRVPRDLRPRCTLSDSRLPQPKGPGSRIYIAQEQGGPVVPPGTGSQETSYVSSTRTNRLMLFGEIIALCCENHAEHINTLCVWVCTGFVMLDGYWIIWRGLQVALKILHFAHRVNLCISYDFHMKQAVSLNCINRLVSPVEMHCVSCEVGTEYWILFTW
jgi:hypothetical protein